MNLNCFFNLNSENLVCLLKYLNIKELTKLCICNKTLNNSIKKNYFLCNYYLYNRNKRKIFCCKNRNEQYTITRFFNKVSFKNDIKKDYLVFDYDLSANTNKKQILCCRDIRQYIYTLKKYMFYNNIYFFYICYQIEFSKSLIVDCVLLKSITAYSSTKSRIYAKSYKYYFILWILKNKKKINNNLISLYQPITKLIQKKLFLLCKDYKQFIELKNIILGIIELKKQIYEIIYLSYQFMYFEDMKYNYIVQKSDKYILIIMKVKKKSKLISITLIYNIINNEIQIKIQKLNKNYFALKLINK